jgi:two-component system phosphate regulon sensor histidine kinase PhoR
MKRRLRVALSLMIVSIGLLVILQIFWVKSVYEKAYLDIRQDVNFMFRNVIYALRDSTFARSIESSPDDSAFQSPHPFDTTSAALWELEKTDTGRVAKVILSINSQKDSAQDNIINNIPPGFQLPRFNGRRRLVIRMMPETLEIDSIDFMIERALKVNGIPLHAKVRHRHREGTIIQHSKGGFHPLEPPEDVRKERDRFNHEDNIYQDTVLTEFIMYNPMNHYAASIGGVRTFLLKQISPQILFSLFLTCLTCLSFLFLYRNLRTQQRLVEMKNDFISNVTHELKTPVATVSVALEALKNFRAMENPELTRDYLAIAQGEISRLSKMTDKILEVSIDDQKGLPREVVVLDLDHIIEDALSSIRVLVEKRNGSVKYIKEGTNFEMRGERMHISNVILNLLDNAMKYCRDRPEILISLQVSMNELILSISDTGIGIASQYHELIFEKFFRVPSGDVHNTKGYGLGLSYVANVVRRHGGKIRVDSNPGEGSTFTILFTRKVA